MDTAKAFPIENQASLPPSSGSFILASGSNEALQGELDLLSPWGWCSHQPQGAGHFKLPRYFSAAGNSIRLMSNSILTSPMAGIEFACMRQGVQAPPCLLSQWVDTACPLVQREATPLTLASPAPSPPPAPATSVQLPPPALCSPRAYLQHSCNQPDELDMLCCDIMKLSIWCLRS